MSLYDRIFGEAVDRAAQQKRLNKVVKPLAAREKKISDELFKFRSDPYHDTARAGRGGSKLAGVQDTLERAKRLKALVTARSKRDEAPHDEKAADKAANAKDYLTTYWRRAWDRKAQR